MVQPGIIETEGIVTEALPSAQFRVKLADESIIIAHLSGKLRINYIKILPGDRVKLQLTKYDKTKGRITYRMK